jgi:hypothetical protein
MLQKEKNIAIMGTNNHHHPNFLLHFPNRQEDFATALASTQET